MHALIVADMEGITELYSMNDKERCKALYTNEIEVFIKVLRKNGIAKITVCDAHDKGDMINKDLIDKHNVDIVEQVWNMDLAIGKYDFAILAGFHGKDGSQGFIPHTFRYEISGVLVNGVAIGEVEIFCRWLGGKGIPVILVTGDNCAAFEGNQFNPYRMTCCIKSVHAPVYEDGSDVLYAKIESCVRIALGLDFAKCKANDDVSALVEIRDKDMLQMQSVSAIAKDERLVFASCSDLVINLKQLADSFNQKIRQRWTESMKFVEELRNIVKNLPQDAVDDSRMKMLLDKPPTILTNEEKEEIKSYLRRKADESSSLHPSIHTL